jgi:hypothetical protein
MSLPEGRADGTIQNSGTSEDAMRILVLIAFLAGLAPAAAQPRPDAAAGAYEVDLELVLAVDVSYSMDSDELILQREGYISAITSPQVLEAIKEGVYGRIAVVYLEWAGEVTQGVPVPWQIIDGPESAQIFADKLAEAPKMRAYRTSISSALFFAAKLFDKNPYKGPRRVIDISGDGPNNQGHVVTWARDQVVAQGIGINGLPLTLKPPNAMTLDVTNLEDYYRECVIGGPGAFVIPVKDKARFAEAIRTKLVLEISSREPPPRFIRAQAKQTVNCSIGEKIWRERYGDGGPEWQ